MRCALRLPCPKSHSHFVHYFHLFEYVPPWHVVGYRRLSSQDVAFAACDAFTIPSPLGSWTYKHPHVDGVVLSATQNRSDPVGSISRTHIRSYTFTAHSLPEPEYVSLDHQCYPLPPYTRIRPRSPHIAGVRFDTGVAVI